MVPLETNDGIIAAFGVQCDQKITTLIIIVLCDAYSMTEVLKNLGPTQRSDFVAVVKAQRRWSNELNSHDCATLRRFEIRPKRLVDRACRSFEKCCG